MKIGWLRVFFLLVLALLFGCIVVLARSPVPVRDWLEHPREAWLLDQGRNPQVLPVTYPAPAPVSAPLSAAALLGRQLFFDPHLSGSGLQSCASCHDPGHAYAPGNARAVQLGGKDLKQAGVRAVPSLRYLYRQPNFSIGPDNPANENVSLSALAQHAPPPAAKSATATVVRIVPQGGLFWDGRADTLQQQAGGPLFNPLEMGAGSIGRVYGILRASSYASAFARLFGAGVLNNPDLMVNEAQFAIAHYQMEDPSFHPYTSKFDAWLQGRARFTREEVRGYLAFNDPKRGNCAACHLDRPTKDGLPPLLTDMQYEALGVPRNAEIPANRNPHYFDLGLCGPYRTDLGQQTHYCGMFLTPTLRNVATRHAFFHNGEYHTLAQVMDFYELRDTEPQTIYGKDSTGKTEKFNDIPLAERGNVDVTDAPLDRKAGEVPAMSAQDRRDIVAFLQTLNDGYSADQHPK